RGQRRVAAVAGTRQCLQRTSVQPRVQDVAARVPPRRAPGGAEAQRRYPVPGRRSAGGGGDRVAASVVGQQQDVAVGEACLAQQCHRLPDGGRGIAGRGRLQRLRHDVGRQRIQEQRDVGGVVGQGR